MKTAIVTGASAGIGKATAKRLHQQGYEVFAGARRVEKMQDLAAIGVHVHALDVTDQNSNQVFVTDVLAQSSTIDVIVNSAGYSAQGALEDVSPEEAKRQFDVNVFGLMNLTQLVLPTMRHQRAGKVINISSIGGQIYSPLGGWYYASKHALEALSDTLRMEVKRFGIDVIIVEPSGTKTEWGGIATQKLLDQTPTDSAYRDIVDRYVKNSGFSNFSTTPDTIADLILKAITARKPRTRYLPDFTAKLLVFAARKLPYKALDRMMFRSLKQIMAPNNN
ncbi:oxidoreductase [Secundilactobacillus collinoides]|uniref:Short chain dehydrogenase n=3 Tax=Secundilactobacillus collinoides TaxID=33960 RepID=A0A0R2B6A9_SECCO|nr:oxidoreductase [Secundilactobacillus collinoides]KRM74904.1 short chain dehydrogenase [Secundilactobacillus collinoides DSM 20515 = JCM 1123]KZL39392.1 short-chain dehydrogenase [Secundilactobacillus collinoides]